MKHLVISLLVLFTSVAHGMEYPISATSSWIEVAARSPFVGIIECVRAGATVSEFKVVETWKGEAITETFHYRGTFRPGGRLLVCMEPDTGGYETYRYYLNSLLQPVGGGELTLSTWPEAAPDYHAVDSIVRSDIHLSADGSETIQHFYAREHTTLGAFRETLRKLLDSDGARREAILIEGALAVLLETPPELELLFQPGSDGSKHDQYDLNTLLGALLRTDSPLDRERVGWSIGRAGGEHTLRFLESAPTEDAEHAAWLAKLKEEIRARLARSTTQSDRYLPKIPAPLRETEARRNLVKFSPVEGSDPEWERAVLSLLDSDPVFLAGYIADFDASPFPYRGALSNFALWFAQNCRTDHVKCYRKLSKSKLPAVAATGALYLSLADAEKGIALLEIWAKKPGPLTQWAADALVLHGRREYVAQALANVRDAETNSGAPLLPPLASAVAAVLANAAHEAAIPLPLDNHGGRAAWLLLPTDGSPAKWWEEHGDQLVLKPLPLQWPIPSEKK